MYFGVIYERIDTVGKIISSGKESFHKFDRVIHMKISYITVRRCSRSSISLRNVNIRENSLRSQNHQSSDPINPAVSKSRGKRMDS